MVNNQNELLSRLLRLSEEFCLNLHSSLCERDIGNGWLWSKQPDGC